MAHILIIDDDPRTRAMLAEIVKHAGFTTAVAASLREAKLQILRQAPDVVFTDLQLPDGNGMDVFEALQSEAPADVIVITGHASVESAVHALRCGAVDYLTKPLSVQRLQAILDRIPRVGDLKAEIGELRSQLRSAGRFGAMVGNSPAMQQLYEQISKVAPTEVTVLLIGESGTGKELAAQAIHDFSRRRKGPFLAVNCGAISPNLIESEMFGHEKGSFTGAERQHKGYFERADGGTLFLDEITEMPLDLQVKLLRVLETGLFMRVGTNREIACDVRVLAATNRDPERAVAAGRLREDLYHRLNVIPLRLPPLRERGRDVELIAQGFLAQLNAQSRTEKVFTPEALAAMRRYDWPGNVRELRNYVQRAYIMADGDRIEASAIDLPLLPDQASHASRTGPGAGAQVSIPVGVSLAEADRRLIFATLQQCGGVKKHTAEVLGISLKTLYNRLSEYAATGHEPDGEARPD
jgi:Response regulator containing CheY-like receiver, AAA-type ATPase, and DNA-binding domains